jgi:hypothetical protein
MGSVLARLIVFSPVAGAAPEAIAITLEPNSRNSSAADRLQIGLVSWLRADVTLVHPEHLSVVTGVRA